MIHDLIIIGGGPAGTAASVYAARKKLNTLFITDEWGGQSTVSEEIYNWIGTVAISGAKLAEGFKNHVMANTGDTLSVKEGERVEIITKEESNEEKTLFKVKTNKGNEYLSRTILITTGSSRKKLITKGADRLEHKGLTYCASCDGPLFDGMPVAVIGGGNSAFESAAQLLAYCSEVTIINRSDTFRADEVTVEKVLKNPKVKVLKNTEILEVKGDKFVEGIVYRLKSDTEGKEQELKVSGIFVEIGQIPSTSFVKDIVPLDEFGRIKIDAWTNQTETKGIWAAGDCTNILYHQNNIAAGDAVKALEDIYVTLNTK